MNLASVCVCVCVCVRGKVIWRIGGKTYGGGRLRSKSRGNPGGELHSNIREQTHTLSGELQVAEAVSPPPLPLLKNENYQPIDVWKPTALYHIALPKL